MDLKNPYFGMICRAHDGKFFHERKSAVLKGYAHVLVRSPQPHRRLCSISRCFKRARLETRPRFLNTSAKTSIPTKGTKRARCHCMLPAVANAPRSFTRFLTFKLSWIPETFRFVAMGSPDILKTSAAQHSTMTSCLLLLVFVRFYLWYTVQC